MESHLHLESFAFAFVLFGQWKRGLIITRSYQVSIYAVGSKRAANHYLQLKNLSKKLVSKGCCKFCINMNFHLSSVIMDLIDPSNGISAEDIRFF